MNARQLKITSLVALTTIAFAMSPVHAQTNTTSRTNAMIKEGGAKSTVSSSDQKLMTKLAQANIAEIGTAELAQNKSKNESVLKFSKQMIADHTSAQSDLTALAGKKNVQLPMDTDAKHKAALKKMSALNGTAFDREYIAMAAMADHQEAVKLVGTIAKDAKDPELKALGIELLPTIENHLKMAKELSSAK
jgi:putative membrane protein